MREVRSSDPGSVIVVSNLSKWVGPGNGRLNLLKDVNLTLNRGETLALVGSSGSGKSTLLGLMAGLDQPSKGSVTLLGHDLGSFDEDARAALRARHVGFVFQSFQLLSYLTALENVMLPLELQGLPARARAEQMLKRVGLSHRLHHSPKTLSGGEQQRVALARACVVKPEILFADEPTGSLDTATGAQVIDVLFELRQECASTLVLVTHDEQLARRCDRRLEVANGTVTERLEG